MPPPQEVRLYIGRDGLLIAQAGDRRARCASPGLVWDTCWTATV